MMYLYSFISGPGICGTVNIARTWYLYTGRYFTVNFAIPILLITIIMVQGAGGVYSTDPYYIQYDGFTDVFYCHTGGDTL